MHYYHTKVRPRQYPAIAGFHVRHFTRPGDIQVHLECCLPLNVGCHLLAIVKLLHSLRTLHLVIDSTGLKVYGEGEWMVRARQAKTPGLAQAASGC